MHNSITHFLAPIMPTSIILTVMLVLTTYFSVITQTASDSSELNPQTQRDLRMLDSENKELKRQQHDMLIRLREIERQVTNVD